MLKGIILVLTTVVLLGLVGRYVSFKQLDPDLVGEWQGQGPHLRYTGVVFRADGYGEHVQLVDGEKTWGPPFLWRIVNSRLEVTGIDEEGDSDPSWATLHDYRLSEDKQSLTIEPPPEVFSPSNYRRVAWAAKRREGLEGVGH